MKKTQRTGKAFRIKWLVLALAAMALILMPAASQKVSASKLVYTVKFNNNSGSSRLSEPWLDHTERKHQSCI